MANLYLRRFSTLENYRNADIEDGTFFVIVESGQLGVRKGDLDILTPPETLYDYPIPDGEVIITQNDTITQAFVKLEKRLISLGEDVQIAKSDAKEAKDALGILTDNENYSDWEKAITGEIIFLKERHQVVSESEFEALPGIKPNYIYYIYEDDEK